MPASDRTGSRCSTAADPWLRDRSVHQLVRRRVDERRCLASRTRSSPPSRAYAPLRTGIGFATSAHPCDVAGVESLGLESLSRHDAVHVGHSSAHLRQMEPCGVVHCRGGVVRSRTVRLLGSCATGSRGISDQGSGTTARSSWGAAGSLAQVAASHFAALDATQRQLEACRGEVRSAAECGDEGVATRRAPATEASAGTRRRTRVGPHRSDRRRGRGRSRGRWRAPTRTRRSRRRSCSASKRTRRSKIRARASAPSSSSSMASKAAAVWPSSVSARARGRPAAAVPAGDGAGQGRHGVERAQREPYRCRHQQPADQQGAESGEQQHPAQGLA